MLGMGQECEGVLDRFLGEFGMVRIGEELVLGPFGVGGGGSERGMGGDEIVDGEGERDVFCGLVVVESDHFDGGGYSDQFRRKGFEFVFRDGVAGGGGDGFFDDGREGVVEAVLPGERGEEFNEL